MGNAHSLLARMLILSVTVRFLGASKRRLAPILGSTATCALDKNSGASLRTNDLLPALTQVDRKIDRTDFDLGPGLEIIDPGFKLSLNIPKVGLASIARLTFWIPASDASEMLSIWRILKILILQIACTSIVAT